MAKLKFAFTLALTTLLLLSNAQVQQACNTTSLYPNIVDASHASAEALSFFTDFFIAKSSDNGPSWANTFSNPQGAYYDSTLSLTIGANYSALLATFDNFTAEFKQNAPDGRSYPLRILGDTVSGAIVHFVNTPSLFGAEIRVLASFDFLNGKISRQIDNWNGRGNPVIKSLKGDTTYPYPFGASQLPELAAPQVQSIPQKLKGSSLLRECIRSSISVQL